MQQKRPTHPRGPQTLGQLGGSCLLLLYLVTATPLALALTALLAASDRSHHVAIQQTDHGLQVLLRHDSLHSLTHRHGIIARALTAFAERTTASHPDHAIQFGATDTLQQIPAPAIEPQAQSPALDAFPACDVLIRALCPTAALAAFPRPSPDASGILLTVRSTVLLI